jgi:hypothetical protein
MKKVFKWFVLAGAAFMGLFVLMVLVVAVSSSKRTPPVANAAAGRVEAKAESSHVAQPDAAKPNLEVLDKIQCGGSDTMTTVSGRIRNNTQKRYSYVQVSYSLLNGAREKVGTAFANTSSLEPGQVWRFEASGFVDAKTCKLDTITGF